jgi:transcriptional regulator with XRE-family HTH domain
MSSALPASLICLRKKRKLSQREAAAQLNISQSMLSHYERGIREGSLDFLVRAAQFYAVSCDVLLGRDTEEAAVRAFLQTEAALEADHSLCLATIARAAAALSGGDEHSPLVQAVAVLLLRAIGQQEVPAHWLNAALEEILSGVQKKKSTAACVTTVRDCAVEIVREILAERCFLPSQND